MRTPADINHYMYAGILLIPDWFPQHLIRKPSHPTNSGLQFDTDSPTSMSGLQSDMRFPAPERSGVRFLTLWATLLTLALVAVAYAGQSDEAFRVGVTESLTGPGETCDTVANQSKHMAAGEINPCRH